MSTLNIYVKLISSLYYRLWYELYAEWLLVSPRGVLVVHHAHLRDSVSREVRRIHDYFRLPVTDKRLRCLDVLRFEGTKRDGIGFKPSEADWGPEVLAKVEKAVERLNKILERAGHQKIPKKIANVF